MTGVQTCALPICIRREIWGEVKFEHFRCLNTMTNVELEGLVYLCFFDDGSWFQVEFGFNSFYSVLRSY